jgi:hypothetical protein
VRTNIKKLDVEQMLPEYEKYKNFEELDKTSTLIRLKAYSVSDSMFAYLKKIFPKIITSSQ